MHFAAVNSGSARSTVSTLDRRWIAGYLTHLSKERRLSPHTSSNYARDIDALAGYLERANVTDWKRVDSQHVRMFAARAHAGGLGPRSVQRRLSAVRGFFGYLVREGAAASNPAVDIRAPKAARRLPGTLDVDQINQLLETPGGRRARAARPRHHGAVLFLRAAPRGAGGTFDSPTSTFRPHRARDGQGLQDAHRARGPQGGRGHSHLAARTWRLSPTSTRRRCSWGIGERLRPRAIQLRIAHWARRAGPAEPRLPPPVPAFVRDASA